MASCFFGIYIGIERGQREADDAKKRLNELTEQYNTDKIRMQTEFEIELERRIDQAKIEARAEMVEELARLNKELEEQQQAYYDLEQAFDELKQATDEAVEMLYGPTGTLDIPKIPTAKGEPIATTAMLIDIDDWYGYTLGKYHNTDNPYLRSIMINYGRYLCQNNIDLPIALSNSGLRGVKNVVGSLLDSTSAFKVIYNGFRWDSWIGVRGYWGRSPFYEKGISYCDYLFRRGRNWANCLATLEAESSCGVGGTCYFGILYGNYPNTIEGYCDLLDNHGVGNDAWEQSCFWNMPGYPNYQEGFCRIVSTLEGFWP
jgi:hypothetical protein